MLEAFRAAEQALDAVELALGGLPPEYGESIDLRRIRLDLTRLREDLGLLAASPEPVAPNPAQEWVLVPDTSYDPGFWRDAADEGLGHPAG